VWRIVDEEGNVSFINRHYHRVQPFYGTEVAAKRALQHQDKGSRIQKGHVEWREV
jgi:hypothetical protein